MTKAVARHVRWQAWWEKELALQAVFANPDVRRLRDLLAQQEARSGRELRDFLQVFQDRHDQAVRTADTATLASTCTARHSRWGQVCVLTAGHEGRCPHWGTTPKGPLAWTGGATREFCTVEAR
ncbi:hypothetical protein ACFTXJ_15250 [Streptomyces zhihengii]|uniref:hypothetical protein n=1 Tax=Streptomyces zhihengii TaxID=1818004 RepID=UPI003632B6A7